MEIDNSQECFKKFFKSLLGTGLCSEYGLSCAAGLLFYWKFFNSPGFRSLNEPELTAPLHWYLNSKASPWTRLPRNMALHPPEI